uniref:Uncharacterized protein n=1 Tax=Trypanosoma congolense (strain IL3000) TaxID=1068625 RepID=G0UL54_TRYCI|nr:conserved hypothetical protein [Trypanosoma congolense IL3000]
MRDTMVVPGETYRILAPSSSLHKYLTDSYWCSAMEEVCEGKLDGVVVRYTGQHLVLLQFRPNRLSPAGYRYPISISIPVEYLVPSPSKEPLGGCDVSSASDGHEVKGTDCRSNGFSPLCVVCGKYDVTGMVLRHHGYKCAECVGHKSAHKLRIEGSRRR